MFRGGRGGYLEGVVLGKHLGCVWGYRGEGNRVFRTTREGKGREGGGGKAIPKIRISYISFPCVFLRFRGQRLEAISLASRRRGDPGAVVE